jgi:hypothetical protein
MIETLKRVRLKNGAYHYDLGRDEHGVRRSKKLCRADEGESVVYRATTIKDMLLLFLGSAISEELAKRGHRDATGKQYVPETIRRMLARDGSRLC